MELNIDKKSGQNPLYKQLIADGNIETIALNLVDQDPDQPRSWQEVEQGAATLAPSLQQHGLIQHPVYQKQSDGRYLVIVGACRTLAAKINGWKEITAIVKQFPDDKKIAEIRWAENDENTRRTLKPIDEAKYWFDYIAEFYTTENSVDIKTAALKMGVNSSRISQFLGIYKSSEVVKNLIIEQNITDYQLCYELYLLEKTSKLHFDEFVKRWLTGKLSQSIQINVKEVKRRAKKGLMPFDDMEVTTKDPKVTTLRGADEDNTRAEVSQAVQAMQAHQPDNNKTAELEQSSDSTDSDERQQSDLASSHASNQTGNQASSEAQAETPQAEQLPQNSEPAGKPIGDHCFGSLDVSVGEINLLFKTNSHGAQLGKTEILALKEILDQWCEHDRQ